MIVQHKLSSSISIVTGVEHSKSLFTDLVQTFFYIYIYILEKHAWAYFLSPGGAGSVWVSEWVGEWMGECGRVGG